MTTTIKPISTISYNSINYLCEVLNGLEEKGAIQFYAFVKHYGETDENGYKEKDHIHLFIEPSSRLDTIALRGLFKEYDLNDVIKKPLGVQPFRPSVWGDWFLYSLHDVKYLSSKGMVREYHYSIDDVVTNDFDYMMEKVHTINIAQFDRMNEIIARAESGQSFDKILRSGLVPLNLVSQARNVYQSVGNSKYHDYKAGDEYGYHKDKFGRSARNEKEWTGKDIEEENEIQKQIFSVDDNDLPF